MVNDFMSESPSNEKSKSPYSFLDEEETTDETKGSEKSNGNGEKGDSLAGKKNNFGIELNLTASGEPTSDDEEKRIKQALFEAVKKRVEKRKKGWDYTYLEGLEGEIDSNNLSKVFEKKEQRKKARARLGYPKAEAFEAETPRLGGLLGKVLTGGTQAAEEGISGLDEMDRAAKMDKSLKGKLIESGIGYRILKSPGEKSLTYVVSLPELSPDDKRLLREIGRRSIAEINVDPEAMQDYTEKKRIFTEKVIELIDKEYPGIADDKKRWFSTFIVQDMIGYGILDPLLANDALEEVMLIGTNMPVYVYHRKHGMCKTNILFEEDEAALKIISRIARAVGRRVDASTPLLDARLKDGSRVNATVAPISLGGPSLTIRKFKADPFTVVDIMNFGTLTPDLASFLWIAIEGFEVKPANILVSGGTGSGKTTTLNCLGSFIPQTNRIISIEDTAELQVPVKHWIRLETRPQNIEGKGEINMERLLRNTLRMRPDRIIVGEVRGPEANTLMTAMNTGQSGSMGTLHANNSKETITRLINKPMSVPVIMIGALNLIIMQNRFNYRGKTVRRITEVTEIRGVEDGQVKLSNIFEWDPKTDKVISTGVPSRIKSMLAEKRGVTTKEIDEEIDRRKNVLKWMLKENVKGISTVGELINDYYIDKDAFLERIGAPQKRPEEKKIKKSKPRGLGDLFAKEKKLKESLIEKTKHAEITKIAVEKNPVYKVEIPTLSKDDRILLKEIETKVIDKLDLDPSKIVDKSEAETLFTKKINTFITQFYSLGPAKTRDFTKIVVHNLIGYGLIEPLLKDETLEEIMVIGTGRNVYVNHNKYGICRTNISFEEDADIERILERIAASVGRRIDRATPLLDARLLDGSRVNATIPPISIDGPTLTIRKFKADPLTVVDLINFNTLTTEISAYLWYAVEGAGIKPSNILVAGGSGSGKTTSLNVLCSYIPDTERIITIEDTAELQLPATHWVRLETKPPNVEGQGEVDMDELVKNTLRMRPDRVIVGEVRGPEARTLFTAMNTGHDGSMGTLHSNSSRETITRLTNPPMSVPKIMMPALDLILMENRIYLKGKTVRRITEITEVTEEGGEGEETVSLNNVYEWHPKSDTLKPTGQPSVLKQKLARIQGVSLEEIDREIQKRKKVLDHMVKKDIRDIKEVGKIFGRYYSEPDELFKDIEGEMNV